MIGYWIKKFNKCLAVFTLFYLNVLHTTNAGIINYLKDTSLTTYIKNSGMVPENLPVDQVSETVTDVPEMSRIFYSAIGDLVEAVPVFPITFNVPDMVSAFGGLLSGMYNYITGTTNAGESQPKDVLGAMLDIYRHIAVQEDIHDFEFMT